MFRILLLSLTVVTVMAQHPPEKQSLLRPANSQSPTGRDVVPANAAVFTIDGLCGGQQFPSRTPRSGSCVSTVSRQDFESFLDTLKATTRGIIPPFYLNLAEGYADLLVYSDAARKSGVEKDPRFQQVWQITRLRALGDMYRIRIDDQAHQVSAEEIEAYYKANIHEFEELEVRRIALPRNNQADLNDIDYRNKATRLAAEMRERAARGEDMDRLQREAFESLAVKDAPVSTAIAVRRRDVDEKSGKDIFALKPGEVGRMIETPALYLIYKGGSRATLPLAQVRDEIAVTVSRVKLESSRKELADAVRAEYNEDYFGPAKAGKPAPASPSKAKSVPSTAVVLTIHGVCDGRGQAIQVSRSGSCTTAVTRERFESIVQVLRVTSRSLAPMEPRDVAAGYVDLLAYAGAAAGAGLHQDPRFEAVASIARQRALADMYRVKRDEQAHQVTPAEIREYYRANPALFEEVRLRGISVPKGSPGADTRPVAHLAAELRARAARGEDPDKLEADAYRALKLGNPPATTMAPLRMAGLEEKTRLEVSALTLQEVTPVLEIPAAFVIYKLESRRTVPMEEALGEISQTLYRQKLERAIRRLNESVRASYNETYFKPATATQWVSTGALGSNLQKGSR